MIKKASSTLLDLLLETFPLTSVVPPQFLAVYTLDVYASLLNFATNYGAFILVKNY